MRCSGSRKIKKRGRKYGQRAENAYKIPNWAKGKDIIDCPGCEDCWCPKCVGSGCVDTPFSGSDPVCSTCDGSGRRVSDED